MTNITKASQDALKPCPFCGANNEEIMLFIEEPGCRLQCAGCNIEAPHFETYDEAAAAWNTRAALQDKAGEVTVAIDNLYNEHRDGMTNAIFPPVQIGTRLFAAQPAPVVPDDVARYRTIRDGLVYIEPHESGEIYVAGETGVYTKSGDEFDAAIDAIAAAQQKGGQHG